jgi:hypothetical protein
MRSRAGIRAAAGIVLLPGIPPPGTTAGLLAARRYWLRRRPMPTSWTVNDQARGLADS